MKHYIQSIKNLFSKNSDTIIYPGRSSEPIVTQPSSPRIKTIDGADPTLIDEVYWLSHYSSGFDYPVIGDGGGKWLIYSDVANINSLWIKVKNAQDSGLLGNRCEVTTAKPTNMGKAGVYCIRVYTYDHNDEADVMRVLDAILELGVKDTIYYKAMYMTFKYNNDFKKQVENKENEFKYIAN